MSRKFTSAFLFLFLTLTITLSSSIPSRAEDLIWATGRVFNADGRTPLAGAIVAVYDDKNRVVDYAKTDSAGNYALALPRSAMHLDRKGGGFFHTVTGLVGGVGRIAAMPLKMGIKAAAGISSATDPITRVGIGAASGVAQGLVDNMSPSKKKLLGERSQPGVVVMKVSLPGHNDAISIARVYWMEEQIYKTGNREQRSLAAWFDPVHLTGAGAEKPSTIESKYLNFTEARLEPGIVEQGQTVSLSVKMPIPPDPRTPVIVVAKNSRTGRFFELTSAGNGIYRTEFVVDKKFPKDDQVFTVIAYAEQDELPGRNKKAENAINGAGLFDPTKPYIYNPLLVVSRNRAEVVLTVVGSSKKR
jgi:hypothetical protein